MAVWYFDAEERAEAKKKFRNLTSKCLAIFSDFSFISFVITLFRLSCELASERMVSKALALMLLKPSEGNEWDNFPRDAH